MKRLSIFLTLLVTTSASAQQAGQLCITSYDDTGQIVYICNGQTQNTVTNGAISVYPSITDKSTRIKIASDGSLVKLTITNDVGMVLSHEEIPPETSDYKINTSAFPEGFYFLNVSSSKGSNAVKLFVHH